MTTTHQCRLCSYRITDLCFLSANFDYPCPRCGGQALSQFKVVCDGDAEKEATNEQAIIR